MKNISQNDMRENKRYQFKLKTQYKPSGDQPAAIENLLNGLNDSKRNQVLLGVTGSGKTFTMANIIAKSQRPTLIMAPNKTLAAQLYVEMKHFFPDNIVEYFVSYYDYYQPEAYISRTDTYIEKDSSINQKIDQMRHAATRAILERNDCINVASVSCIYGIGSRECYIAMSESISVYDKINRNNFMKRLVELQYSRTDLSFERGKFRVHGDIVEIFPVHAENYAWRISIFDDKIEKITEFNPLTGHKLKIIESIVIYANSHYVTPKPTIKQAIFGIKQELKISLSEFRKENNLLAAERIEKRTNFDIEMLETIGHCKGIENYSRWLSGRNQGDPPPTLFEYFPKNALLFVDESHVTIPQIRGMYRGDYNRKLTLANNGFRLPSCLDNRPLHFEEWDKMRPQTIFFSATPGAWELESTSGIFCEQLIRPTGVVDPICILRSTDTQVDDLLSEIKKCEKKNQRVLVTTLTKRMSETLSEYLHEHGIRVRYIHSELDTIERIDILRDLRLGIFDVLVGINLLREGLNIPECALVAILDADKEGFLRSKTSLIQTIGRAARNVDGRVILYADKMTESIAYALSETNRRRKKQISYNKKLYIQPKTVSTPIHDVIENIRLNDNREILSSKDNNNLIQEIEKRMHIAAENLHFEEAAQLRNEIIFLKKKNLKSNNNKKKL